MFQTSIIFNFLLQYRYLALFPLACIEGPILALVVGFMVHLGYFSFIPAYFIMVLGDFVPDSVYYFIGRFGDKEKLIKKYDTKSKLISKNFNYFKKAWHEHTLKTMFIGKLAYSLSIPFLISAGIVHLPYKKFVWQALIVTLFQYGLLMTVGYYLGESYQTAIPFVKEIGIFIALLAIIFIVIYFKFQKNLKKKIINEIKK